MLKRGPTEFAILSRTWNHCHIYTYFFENFKMEPKYQQPLVHGFLPGSRLTLRFTIPPVSTRFSFNFECGNNTTAFHFNPRFDASEIVRNTKVKGGWGFEERNGTFPFQKGQSYSVMFQCTETHFTTTVVKASGGLAINNSTYNHRLPFQSITNFTVFGDVNVLTAAYVPGDKKSLEFATATHPSCLAYNLKYAHPLIRGFLPGSQLKVEIKIPQDSDRFYFNFEGPDSLIPFHFNPRFAAGQVVRNSLIKGQWGIEEKDGVFPFQKGQSYSLLFQCTDAHFTVAVATATGNQLIIFDYKHRVDVKLINVFTAVGEVSVISVG